MRDFSKYTLPQLEQFVINYNKNGDVHGAEYAALLRAREAGLSSSNKLDIYKSLDTLKAMARKQSYVSYGEIAAASGMAWSHELRARMSGPKGHLDRLLDLCQHKRLPLLTAICVNKQNIGTGILEDFALAGFIAGAKRLGRKVDDDAIFLQRCQVECFAWGRGEIATT